MLLAKIGTPFFPGHARRDPSLPALGRCFQLEGPRLGKSGAAVLADPAWCPVSVVPKSAGVCKCCVDLCFRSHFGHFGQRHLQPRRKHRPSKMRAWKVVAQGGVKYRKSMDMNDLAEDQCNVDERFFAKVESTPNGSAVQLWLAHEDGRYLPAVHPSTQTWLFEEVTWVCGKDAVTYCKTPNMADATNDKVVPGASISALPAPSNPGWLQEAGTKMYLPMNDATTGSLLFTAASGTVAPGQVAMSMNSAPLPVGVSLGKQTGPVQAPPKPAGVPENAVFVHERYTGQLTMAAGCVGCLCCGLPGCIICCIGLDERDVWITPDGQRWDIHGAKIEAA